VTEARAVVIGAGMGGLAAALALAARGVAVTLVERQSRPGGKMREIHVHDAPVDSGPTVFTMPWVFEEVFAEGGAPLSEHVAIEPFEVLARHGWTDGSRLDLFADPERSAAAIGEFAGAAEADRYRAFCRRARRTFDTLHDPFIRSPRPSIPSLVAAAGVRGLLDLWRIRPFRSLWRELGVHFRDHRLRGLFARYATYCGASPLQAPATLMLIAHVEQQGVWRIRGGMQRLAEALADELVRRGGEIRFDATVDEVEVRGGRASGVRLASGERLAADVVVANADVAAVGGGRLGEAAAAAVPGTGPGERSLSAMTWSMLAEPAGFELSHHNVFFPDDYPREFEDIFERGALPSRPAVYVCAPDHAARSGRQRLFMIANAPAIGDRYRFGDRDVAAMQPAVLELLERCGLKLSAAPEHIVVTTPSDFEQRFPGTGGALYGMAPHGWRSSFARPGARSRIPNLYLAGGSVHPGPGVPMAALSGRLAARAVTTDLGLPWPR
jgi:1-hydroxycarotenoid 3,4-desaturase